MIQRSMIRLYSKLLINIINLLIIICMSFYRSDSVNHYNLVIPRESAWDVMNKLGQFRLVHVVANSNPLLSKPFFTQVKRCDESLLKIQSLQKILYEKKVCQPQTGFNQAAYEQLYRVWETQSTSKQRNPISMLDSFEQKVQNSWNYYHDLKQRMENLKKKIDNYRQNLAIIRAGQKKFGRAFFTNTQSRMNQLGNVYLKSISKVGFKTGIIDVADQIRFKRTIFRITKGNCLIQCIGFDEIFQQLQPSQKTKMVYFVLYPAQTQSYFQKKITKLVEMYCDQQFQLPTKNEDFEPLIRSFQDGYNETQKLLSLTEAEMDQYLQVLASPSQQCKIFKVFQYLKLYLIKQKDLYQALNQMQLFNNFLKGQIYVRNEDVPTLHQMLVTIQKNMKIPSGQIIASQARKFPTNFVRNDYTCSAQQIVETYGVPRYKQANPSYFTTITFPFLFGVMFGDIAHGTLMLAFGAFLCFKKDQINHFALKILLPHRYLITLMGFFAMYCGWIYNDFMSISLDIFGSCYDPQLAQPKFPIPKNSPDCVYPVGLDPVWAVAENNLNFVNSLKMKISVIIAVVHMTLGVFVKASNTIYFGKFMEFFFQFVPQLAFLTCLFAYMDFLIIYKWLVNWTPATIAQAPSIITTMINMPLKMGKTDDCCGGWPLWGTPGNTSQDHIQLILLIIAFVSVPLMLLPKPLYQIYCVHHSQPPALMSKKSMEYKQLLSGSSEVMGQGQSQKQVGEQQHEASEIFVHQMIETIEYVLGCISNTASYLRLWALSLAHSQLSQVFFQKTVEGGIAHSFKGMIMMILGFPILAGATFGILLCMDTMECFLHTLRLHWVEFQNKFYKGDGFAFVYYSFTNKINSILQKNS